MQRFRAIGIRFLEASSNLWSGARGSTKKTEECRLLRFFSAFPGGWPGIGLLLLRGSVGIVALLQAGFYLADRTSAPTTWLGGLVGLAAGAALLMGLLTPVAGILTGLGILGIGLSIFTAPTPNLLEAKLSVILAAIISAAIVFLGPGAYSVDARLFGRREIIIPPRSRA